MQQYRSIVADYSSHFASRKSDKYGNGEYEITINNSNHVNSAVKICPHRVLIPNIFPNFNEYNGSVFLYDDQQGFLHEWNFENQNLSVDEFVTAFNSGTQAPDGSNYILTNDSSQNKLQLNYSTGVEEQDDFRYLLATYGFWEQLGFQDIVKPASRLTNVPGMTNVLNKTPNGEEYYSLDVSGATGQYLPSQTEVYNFGGERMINVLMSQGAPGNYVVANGQELNGLITIPMHNVPYGATAEWSSQESLTDMIVFQDVRNISRSVITITDHKYRPLKVPTNWDIHLYIKVFHEDGRPYYERPEF